MILITGGAGYIGSQIARMLLDLGFEILVFDNLITGNQKAIDKRATFIHGDLRNINDIDKVVEDHQVDAIIHLASSCYVGESAFKPLEYYENNIVSTINLLKTMKKRHINKLIFSSSCAVYGNPSLGIIDEDTNTSPINPYGKSKLINETIIKDLTSTFDLKYIILRFFNVAGSDVINKHGEYHKPETHLIPNIINSILKKNECLEIYGNDYQTPDGTCIRDFIHVQDIASAHLMALQALLKKSMTNRIYNLGSGKGYSIKEIISACEQISNQTVNVKYSPRRPGDPDILVANYTSIHKDLGWQPKFSLSDIVKSAWEWHSKFPNGYEDYEK